MKRIAVIMSLYKNDIINYVSCAVESILNQTYNDFDVFIMCDGKISPMVDAYLSNLKDNRINIYRREENKGLAFSLNELLTVVISKGYEFIARMDADDISVSDRFQNQIDFLESHPNVDLVGGYINEIDELGRDKGKITKYPIGVSNCRNFFRKRNPVAHPTVVFRKIFFEKTKCFYPIDFERNEDTRLWHEGYKHNCTIDNVSKVVLNFRVTDSMFKNRRKGKEFAKSQLQLRKMIVNDLGYGKKSLIYAYSMYFLMISPKWVLKLAYRILR